MAVSAQRGRSAWKWAGVSLCATQVPAPDPGAPLLQVKHEQSKNSFSKEHKRVWESKCAPRFSPTHLYPDDQ